MEHLLLLRQGCTLGQPSMSFGKESQLPELLFPVGLHRLVGLTQAFEGLQLLRWKFSCLSPEQQLPEPVIQRVFSSDRFYGQPGMHGHKALQLLETSVEMFLKMT